jgi:two-component system sensor histidine kinase PilS (NtrC family)
MCVAVAIYLTAALKVQVAAPLDILVTSSLLAASLAVTGASYWHTHLRGRTPGRNFLYLQALFDVVLITTVVHMTGGPESYFAGLYVVLIAVTALLLRPAGSALVTILAGLVYFADVFFGHPIALPPGIWVQLAVFLVVAVVTAYITSRVSVMGEERAALVAEVRQVRLEASDVLKNLRTGVLTVDSEGKLLYCNPAAEELLGVRAAEWGDRPIMPEVARIAPEFHAAVTSTARRGVRMMRVEATVYRPDRTFPIGVTTTTLEVQGDGPPRVTAIFTDISDSKRLEELHLRAERLEAVAELSSSLAHEIKNPLASQGTARRSSSCRAPPAPTPTSGSLGRSSSARATAYPGCCRSFSTSPVCA